MAWIGSALLDTDNNARGDLETKLLTAERREERLAELLREVYSSDTGWNHWGGEIEDLFESLGLDL